MSHEKKFKKAKKKPRKTLVAARTYVALFSRKCVIKSWVIFEKFQVERNTLFLQHVTRLKSVLRLVFLI